MWIPRRIGQSTSLALQLLSTASHSPGKWFEVADHFGTRQADVCLFKLLQEMGQRLDLKLEFRRPGLSFRSVYYGFEVNSKLGGIRDRHTKALIIIKS